MTDLDVENSIVEVEIDLVTLEDKVERLEDRALELEARAKVMRNLQIFHAFALALIGLSSYFNYVAIS